MITESDLFPIYMQQGEHRYEINTCWPISRLKVVQQGFVPPFCHGVLRGLLPMDTSVVHGAVDRKGDDTFTEVLPLFHVGNRTGRVALLA